MPTIGEFRKQRRNANKHTERGLKLLSESVDRDGWIGALTVAADGETFDGSARLVTAQQDSQLEPIIVDSDGSRPVIVRRTDIATADDPKAKRLGVMANHVTATDWEPDAAVLAEIAKDDAVIAALAKEDARLAELLRGEAKQEPKDAGEQLTDRADEIQEKWHCAFGDVWAIGEHRLFCVDSEKDFARLTEGVKAKLTLTDPPYGISVVSNFTRTDGAGKPVTIGAIRAHRKYPFGGVKNMRGTDGSAHWVDATPYKPVHGDDKPFDPTWLLGLSEYQIIWGGNYFASKLSDSRCWLVWDKNNTGNFADCELAWTNFEKSVRIYRHTWNGLVREGSRAIEGERRLHPTQKPASMLAEILKDFSDEDDLIYDPYSGSGSTLVACVITRRVGYVSEYEPSYCAVTLERLSKLGLTPQRITRDG